MVLIIGVGSTEGKRDLKDVAVLYINFDYLEGNFTLEDLIDE